MATFGRHWSDLMVDLGAVQIETNNGHLQIRAFSKDFVAAHPDMVSTSRHRWWLLRREERLVSLDICRHAWGITGVRLKSNQRESPWYGPCVGWVDRLEAPSHFCINWIYGTIVDDEIVELGIRCEPREHTTSVQDLQNTERSRCPLIRQAPTMIQKGGNMQDFESFTVGHARLRAVDVVCSSSGALKGIGVLSHAQYQRMETANHERRQGLLNDDEDMVVLAEGETILSVEIAKSVPMGRIVALRLVTDLGTSPWLGRLNADEVVVSHLRDAYTDNETICGFHGINDEFGFIADLTPLYHQTQG